MVRDASLEAYESVLPNINGKRLTVFKVIADAKRPICDKEIAKVLHWEINKVTGRRGELEDRKCIKSVGRSVYRFGVSVHHWVAVNKFEDVPKRLTEIAKLKAEIVVLKAEVTRLGRLHSLL